MPYKAQIILDSVAPCGKRLTTMEVTFPRFILAEFNTHRMFSRNSASSRAIPVEKRIAATAEDPFVPEAFTTNQKGMQGGKLLDGDEAGAARQGWTRAAQAAIDHARTLAALGVHKQYANRILEPFLWHTCIVSATEWQNFFLLRCSPLAQPEIQCIAEMMRDAYNASNPSERDWHMPYISAEDWTECRHPHGDFHKEESLLRQISVARCARVSYLTHDGKRDREKDMELYEKLATSGHWSPFEHVAQAMSTPERSGNFIGWKQYRKCFTNENGDA
jgi:thymidylate synthase ThyX